VTKSPQSKTGEVQTVGLRLGGVTDRLGALAEAYAFPALTALLIVVFSVLPATAETFPTAANAQVILSTQAVPVLVALAVLVPVIANVWDFTPGAVAGFASVLAADVVSSSDSILLAVAVACGIGLLIGLINAVLVVVLKVNSVIATLGMTIVIAGVVQSMTDGTSIVEGIPVSLTDFGSSKVFGIPAIAVIAVGIASVLALILRSTPFGRFLFAVGSNREAARLVGVSVDMVTSLAFIGGGLLAGMAGALLLSQSGAGNPGVGPNYTLAAYAAVFLGTVAISPGRWNVPGVLVAIVFLGCLSSGLLLAGASSSTTDIVNGVALLAGVAAATYIGRKRGRNVSIA
jgi:ribose transport system permease protein